MISIAVLTCLVAVTLASPFSTNVDLDPAWESFKTAYNKQYVAEVEPMRRSIWKQNVRLIEEHNLEADMDKYSYSLGINEYADMTQEEFEKFMLGIHVNSSISGRGSHFLAPSHLQPLPTTVDWRTQGYVTPVKNQRTCGSCWAFSATGSLEGQHFKATGKLVSLSEQNLIDCSGPEGNMGCNGGLPDQAFQYIIKNSGIDTEESYPYKGRGQGAICHFNSTNVGATMTAYTDIPSGNETALQVAVATVGPISVGIDASEIKFRFYRSGVYDNPRCSSVALDHGVLAAGYGTQDNKDYWLVKNSWGDSYGMKGYIMMSRNKNNQCGIATQASYPVV